MEQHPVPQNIASYEFRLVGDMTLKQFLELAGGLVVALVFYASGIPWFFKWPLVFVSAVLGVGLAFFPIEERPLETWLISFIKTIYSPTQYLWKKTPKKPEFLEERPALPPEPPKERIQPQDRLKLTEYLSTLPENKNFLDQKEENFVNQIQNLFSMSTLPSSLTVNAKKMDEAPEPAGIKVRKLSGPFVMEISEPMPTPAVTVPKTQLVQVNFPKYHPVPHPYIPPPPVDRPVSPTKNAVFSSEIPFPESPTLPNLLVGMVTDKEGKILENVILEILDQKGNPVRALRTNKIGQFRTATQLASGYYEMILEKEGFAFDHVRIELKGEIVEPIEIKSK